MEKKEKEMTNLYEEIELPLVYVLYSMEKEGIHCEEAIIPDNTKKKIYVFTFEDDLVISEYFNKAGKFTSSCKTELLIAITSNAEAGSLLVVPTSKGIPDFFIICSSCSGGRKAKSI